MSKEVSHTCETRAGGVCFWLAYLQEFAAPASFTYRDI